MPSSSDPSTGSSIRLAYDAIAPAFSASRRAPWAEFESFLPFVPAGACVLDAGCGNGRLLESLEGRAAVYEGLDLSPELLAEARRLHPAGHFTEGDMAALPYGDGAFDAVFCIAAFHHLPTTAARQAAAAEFWRVLKPGGALVLMVWNLFQPRYAGLFARAAWKFLRGAAAWNDLLVPWADSPIPRYYHAFTPRELCSYFSSVLWRRETCYSSRRGERALLWRAYNTVLILRKPAP